MPMYDDYDPETAKSVYTDGSSSQFARAWAKGVEVHNLDAVGFLDFFEGGGSDPTVLPNYSATKLWLRTASGVTPAAPEVLVWNGIGSASLLTSWVPNAPGRYGHVPGAVYPTRASAVAATIASMVTAVLLLGYATAGDMPLRAYRRVASAPAHADWFQSADGAFWAPNAQDMNVRAFGARGDGVTNDTAAIQAAFNALTAGSTLRFPPGDYLTNGVITCTTDDISIDFQGCRLLMGDTGASGTISDGNAGKIGLLLRNIDGLTITGACAFIGRGTSGVTSLAGLVIDTCTEVTCPAALTFERMAAGAFLIKVSRGMFGDMTGDDIDGLQTFESPPSASAGSLQVLVGCQDLTLGDITVRNLDKPGRYFSVGTGVQSNARITVGATTVSGKSGSSEAHGVALRSAVDCSCGPISVGADTIGGLLVVQYNGDQALGFTIDRVYVESVVGPVSNTPASIEGLVQIDNFDVAGIGAIHIGHVAGRASGLSGVYVSGGRLRIDSASLSGSATRLIQVAASSAAARGSLSIGHLTLEDCSGPVAPVNIGRGATGHFDRITVTQGAAASGLEIVRYDSTIGTGHAGHYGVAVGTMHCRQGAAAFNYSYFITDNSHGFASWDIQHMDGAPAIGQVVLGGHIYAVANGRWMASAPPTLTASVVGNVLWNLTPTPGLPTGWVCSASGLPGTWRPIDEGPRVVGQSAIPSPVTGTTAETVLATIPIPAGAMGPNGSLEYEARFSFTNSANTKTFRVRLGGIGGVAFTNRSETAFATIRLSGWIANRNAQNSQIGSRGSDPPSLAGSTLAWLTAAVDTSTATSLAITGQLASAGETITLESYVVSVSYGG